MKVLYAKRKFHKSLQYVFCTSQSPPFYPLTWNSHTYLSVSFYLIRYIVQIDHTLILFASLLPSFLQLLLLLLFLFLFLLVYWCCWRHKKTLNYEMTTVFYIKNEVTLQWEGEGLFLYYMVLSHAQWDIPRYRSVPCHSHTTWTSFISVCLHHAQHRHAYTYINNVRQTWAKMSHREIWLRFFTVCVCVFFLVQDSCFYLKEFFHKKRMNGGGMNQVYWIANSKIAIKVNHRQSNTK